MSLVSKVFRGSALNAADLVVRMAVMFLMTPFMVSQLGMEGFGTWVVLTTAISFLDLLDGGVTLSGTRFLARIIGRADDHAFVKTAGTLAWLYRRIGWLCLIGTGVLILIAGWILEDATRLVEARQVLAVLGCSLALRFFLRIHLVVLKSHVRYDLIVVSGLAKLVLQTCLIVALLLNGHGLFMLALAQIGSDIFDQVLVVFFSRRTHPFDRLRKPDRNILKDVLSYSFTIFLNTLGQFFRSRLDPLVLSMTSGVATVPVYNTGMRLLTLFGDLMNAIIGGPLLSGFCQVEGSSGIDSLRIRFLQSMRFSVPLATVGAMGLCIYGPHFVERWMGTAFIESGTVLRILVGAFALWLMQLPSTSALLALDRHQFVMKATLVAGAFNLVVSLILAWTIGFYGVVIATALEMYLFYGFIVPLVLVRELKLRFREYYLQAIASPALRIGLPLGLYGFLTHQWLAADYPRLFGLASGFSMVALLSFWGINLTSAERQKFLQSFRRRP